VQSQEQWRRIEAIFNQALDLEESQRPAFLLTACSTDFELRNEVQELLLSAARTAKFLAHPIEGVVQDMVRAETRIGHQIGQYEILSLLGEGGMGKVYLARRADQQYQTTVAIKTIGTFLGAQNRVLVRFRSERQILANLQHANIARLLDGGVTPDGLPYLVMEYVDGLPIDQYCRIHNLSLEDRLHLFNKVCRAVEYAHHHLIVHRDIKPGNILVDESGEPKLLDFGIAKLLEQIPDSNAFPTRATDCLMTPEYASPEQVRGEAISTATDVYGLGVLLYELLTGSRPFRLETRSPLEIVQLICEKQPAPPTAIIAADPASPKRKLSHDLDNIVLMAMRKNPAERYGSVALLAADIQAYLGGYPVLARQHSWTYRTGKFIGRHRLGFSVVVAALVVLIGFSIAMGVLARRANREQQKAQREAEFLAGMFLAASPDEAKGHEITARQLLDRGAKRIDRELASEPDVRWPLLINMAQAYSDLGAYDAGLDLLNRPGAGVELGRLPLLQQAAGLDTKATLYRLKSDYKTAEPLFRRALAIRQHQLRASDPLIAHSLTSLGECLYLEQDDVEAESLLRAALLMRRAEHPDNADDVRNYLALLLERKGDFNEGAQLLSEAVDISRRTGGTESPSYGQSLHNWASALIDVGDLKAAENHLRELLTLRQRVLGPTHPAVTYTLNNLGFVLLEEGEPQLAEPYLKANLDVRRKVYGEDNAAMISGWNNWARYLHATGQYAQAHECFSRALNLAKKESQESWSVAQIESNLAGLALDQGEPAAAEPLARQALAMRLKLGGNDAPLIATSMLQLATIRLYQGDAVQAETLDRQALDLRIRRLAPNNPGLIEAKLRLGETLMAERKYSDAQNYFGPVVRYVHSPPFSLPAWQIAEAEDDEARCARLLGIRATTVRRSRPSDLRSDPQIIFRQPAELRMAEISDRIRDADAHNRLALPPH
jgi:serine/threonine-protein kinase